MKGRIALKVEKKIKANMPEILVKKANEFMVDPSSDEESSSDQEWEKPTKEMTSSIPNEETKCNK